VANLKLESWNLELIDSLARLQDLLDEDFDVGLSMSLEPAVILTAAEVLDHRLCGRLTGHLGYDSGAGDQRPVSPTLTRYWRDPSSKTAYMKSRLRDALRTRHLG
jgi:hypothetical protein